MRFFSFLLIFLISCSSILAQNASVNGKVLDDKNEVIPFATVVAYKASDNRMAKGAVTDDSGNFKIEKLAAAEYYLKISYIGFDEYQSENFNLGENDNKPFGEIKLQNTSTELEGVTVVGKRPIVEVKPDKTTFNVDGSLNATGNNGMELLQKAPGVVVDNEDNVYLAGKSGVRIYINGKPSPLQGADLASFLKSVNSSDIDKIDIITNPSAKYDAEGNAGIIDIKFKKDTRYGANGTLNLGFQQGKYRRYNGGVSGNFRTKKTNVYARYGVDAGTNWWFMDSYRLQDGEYFDLNNDSQNENNAHNVKTGIDYYINKKHTIGFIFDGNFSKSDQNQESTTFIGPQSDDAFVDRTLTTNNITESSRQNVNFNVNYAFDDGEDQTWNVDVDYGFYNRESDQFQPNQYAFSSGAVENLDFRLLTPNNINITSVKFDHERPLKKGKLGFGAKTAFVNTLNTLENFIITDSEEILLTELSSDFDYTENVNAAYANYNFKKDKWGFQGGVRMEQTNSRGILTAEVQTENDDVKRSYIDFFPSAGISYQINPTNSLNLNYSRRINRPNYENLNPFVTKISDVSSFSGNPFLNPQYGNSFSLTYTFKYKYSLTYNYSYTNDFMGMVSKQDPNNEKATTLTWLNLDWQQVHNASISVPHQITKWWSSYSNVSVNYLRNYSDQDIERGISEKIDLSSSFLSYYTQHTFSLPWELKFEVSSWFSSGGIWQGIFKTKPMGSLDLGLQRKFMDGKANLKLAFNDVLKTARWSGSDSFDGISSTARGGWDSHKFRVNFTYMFGNQDILKGRKRKTGLEDENKRASGGGGGRGQ